MFGVQGLKQDEYEAIVLAGIDWKIIALCPVRGARLYGKIQFNDSATNSLELNKGSFIILMIKRKCVLTYGFEILVYFSFLELPAKLLAARKAELLLQGF